MNKLILILFFAFSFGNFAKAQVGIGTEDPHQSAALEISAADKGLLISRLTLNQRAKISSPAVGLLIYQIDAEAGFYFFNGTDWIALFQKSADWNASEGISQVLNIPKLSPVAISGEFSDLGNIPSLIYAKDTSKMLVAYLTANKLIPFLALKADKDALLEEIERAKANEKNNADAIALNLGLISETKIAVSLNSTAINKNTNAISQNNANISDLGNRTGTNTNSILTNAGDIALKEDSANKSSDGTLSDLTDSKFPTEKAVKTFVTNQVASSTSSSNTAIAAVQSDVDANETAATAAIALKEDVANKSSDVTLADATNVKFPTELAVKTFVTSQLASSASTGAIAAVQSDVDANETAANSAIALKEDAANKSSDVTLADASNVKFPTELAVKTFVTSQVASSTSTGSTAIAAVQSDVDANEAAATAAIALKAPLASPTFTDTPVLPTGTTGITQTAADNN